MLAVSVDHYVNFSGERSSQTMVSCRQVGYSKASSDFSAAGSALEALSSKPTKNPAPAQSGSEMDQLPKLIPITESDIAELMVTSGVFGSRVSPADDLKPNVIVISEEEETPTEKAESQFKDDVDSASPLDLSVEANPLNLSIRESAKRRDVTTGPIDSNATSDDMASAQGVTWKSAPTASGAPPPTCCPLPVPCVPPLSASNISTSAVAYNCPVSTVVPENRYQGPVSVTASSPQQNDYNIYVQPPAQEPVQQSLPQNFNSLEQHLVKPAVQQREHSCIQRQMQQPTQYTPMTVPQPIGHAKMSVQQHVQQPTSHVEIPLQPEVQQPTHRAHISVQQHAQQPTLPAQISVQQPIQHSPPHGQISVQQQAQQPMTYVQSCAHVQAQQSVNCVQQPNENRAEMILQPHVRPFLHTTVQYSAQPATVKEQPARRQHYHQHHPLEGSTKLHSRVIMTDKEQHTEEHLKRWQLQIRDMQSYAQQQQQQAACASRPETRDCAPALKRPGLLDAYSERKRPCHGIHTVTSEPEESISAVAAGTTRRQNGSRRSDTSHLPRDILFLVCNICGRSYGNLNGMKRHLGRDHGIQFSIDKICVETISDYKRNHQMPTASDKKNDDVTSSEENKDVFGKQSVLKNPDQSQAITESSSSPDRPEVEQSSKSPSCYINAQQQPNIPQQPIQTAGVQSCEQVTIDLTVSTDSETNKDESSSETPCDTSPAVVDGSQKKAEVITNNAPDPTSPEVTPNQKSQTDLRALEATVTNKSFLLSIVDMLIERCYDVDPFQSKICDATNLSCAVADRKCDSDGSNTDGEKEARQEDMEGTDNNVDKDTEVEKNGTDKDSGDTELHPGS